MYGTQPLWEEEAVTTTYRDFETGTLLSVLEYKHMEGVFATQPAVNEPDVAALLLKANTDGKEAVFGHPSQVHRKVH